MEAGSLTVWNSFIANCETYREVYNCLWLLICSKGWGEWGIAAGWFMSSISGFGVWLRITMIPNVSCSVFWIVLCHAILSLASNFLCNNVKLMKLFTWACLFLWCFSRMGSGILKFAMALMSIIQLMKSWYLENLPLLLLDCIFLLNIWKKSNVWRVQSWTVWSNPLFYSVLCCIIYQLFTIYHICWIVTSTACSLIL